MLSDLFAVDGVMLTPYREWRDNASDPRTAPPQQVAKTLFHIIEMEEPVVTSRAYKAYAKASGVQRLGPQVRRALNRALADLERQQRIVVERPSGGNGYRGALLRTPSDARVAVREIGPRIFDEVPLSELSALIRELKTRYPGVSWEEIYRRVLTIYELKRMTKQVKERLDNARISSGLG